jgi:hypothetical protein
VEARFDPACREGPFPLTVTQHDADGRVARRYAVALLDSTETVDLELEPTAAGSGFAIVTGKRIKSDLYVALSERDSCTVTHGRGEFVEWYPLRARLLLAIVGGVLARLGRSLPAFARDQYAYVGPDSRSHVLLMNLSNVTNRIRVAANREGTVLGARLIALPPMGAFLLDVSSLGPGPGPDTAVWRLRIEGNAWFNLYLVGAGPRDLAGPLSLMHVK